MNIREFQSYMHDLIESAYLTARIERQDEILFPFMIKLKENDQIEFVPLVTRPKRVNHLSLSS